MKFIIDFLAIFSILSPYTRVPTHTHLKFQYFVICSSNMKFLDCTVRITQTYSVLERALHEKHLRLTALPVEAVKAYCKNILYIQPNLLTSAMELRQTATKLHGHIKAQDLDSNFSLPRSHALLQNSIFENTIQKSL